MDQGADTTGSRVPTSDGAGPGTISPEPQLRASCPTTGALCSNSSPGPLPLYPSGLALLPFTPLTLQRFPGLHSTLLRSAKTLPLSTAGLPTGDQDGALSTLPSTE